MKLYNKIFGKKPSVSIDEMENYFSGNLSEKEKYEIELKAQSSDLDFDALEAFEENPERLNEFKNLKSHISSDIFKSNSYLKYFIITGIAATITIFFVFYADIFNKTENNKLIAVNSTKPKIDNITKTENTKELFIDKDADNNTLEEETNTNLNKSNELESVAEVNNEIVQSSTNDVLNSKTQQKQKKLEVAKIESKNIQKLSTIDSISANKKIAFAYNSKIRHLAHYKVVDYSYYKRINHTEKTEEELGIDAKFADKTDKAKKQNLNEEERNYSYFSYLEKALYKYDKQEYTESIIMFNTILEQYPNDVNAFFYKGMAFYQLKKYEKAIKYLDKSIESNFNTFYQEAEFYKALSLLNTNKKEGIKLLNKIANEALFYSQKATIKLSEINE